MERECRNVAGKVVCSINDVFIDRLEEIENICSKTEFTARELFKALDVNDDGIISKEDLETLASEDAEKKYISRNDLKNLYSGIGKKICQGICNIMDNSQTNAFISIDDLLEALDKNHDGKVLFGDFLRISKKDKSLLMMTKEEFESEFDGKWKSKI